MASKIKRGGAGVRRSNAARGRANTARRAKAKTGSVVDTAMGILPFTEEQWHRIFMAIIIGGAVALAWFVASLAGVPAMAQQQIAAVASDAGFEVRRVHVTGVDRMNELKVYERVLGERDRPMPSVDLADVRDQLLQLNWVKDARVMRQLPDTLAVDIVERVPHAVLRKPDRLVLIDATGHELEPISRANARGMLVIGGPGASRQVAALTRLIEAAPALGPRIEAAEWVGNRRWDLTFDTAQLLALPEGSREAASALVTFAEMDGKSRLLGGKIVTFDMRVANRIFLGINGVDRQELDLAGGS